MYLFIYDSSFEGLLCTIGHALKTSAGSRCPDGSQADICISTSENAQLSCLYKTAEIMTDPEISDKLYSRILQRWDSIVLKNIYTAYLYPGSENLILKYFLILIDSGSEYKNAIHHPDLIELNKRMNSVGRESHRWYGFMRFKQLDNGIFYASYEPQYNITPLIMPHFVKRFKNQPLMIHDTSRGYSAVYDLKEIIYTDTASLQIPDFSFDELRYQAMWKEYFEHLSIKERENKKLQMNHVPKKYRKFITEFNNDHQKTADE